jgi:hypothetical protein
VTRVERGEALEADERRGKEDQEDQKIKRSKGGFEKQPLPDLLIFLIFLSSPLVDL